MEDARRLDRVLRQRIASSAESKDLVAPLALLSRPALALKAADMLLRLSEAADADERVGVCVAVKDALDLEPKRPGDGFEEEEGLLELPKPGVRQAEKKAFSVRIQALRGDGLEKRKHPGPVLFRPGAKSPPKPEEQPRSPDQQSRPI